MRGNETKIKRKRYKRLRGVLRRGSAVALGVFLLTSQLDLAAYAVEDSVVAEEADAENPPAVTQPEDGGETDGEGEDTSFENTEEKQPETDDNGGEESEQNPGGDENPIEGAAAEEPAEPVVLAESLETTEREARAGGFNEGEFIYEIIDSANRYVAVSSPYYSKTTLTIPGTVTHDGEEYTVTQILEEGFAQSVNVQEIVIPDSVKVIGKKAFFRCNQAAKITLPQDLEKISEEAFSNCASLGTITIPGNVSVIEKEAFWECKELREVILEDPDRLITYGTSVFWGCEKLPGSEIEKIISSSGMTQIPKGMFIGNKALTQITIPGGITGIGEGAFMQCQGLEKATIPSSVTEIGTSAFEQCKKLTEISMADGLITLGDRAFLQCESLQSVNLPDTVTTVGESAFDACKSLKSVKLSSALSAVSSYMFMACTSLEEVTIPQKVTSIGIYGFATCPALQRVTLLSSATEINDHAFEGGKSLNELRIVVPVTEEGGQKKATPVTVRTSWDRFSKNNVFLNCPQDRSLVFLSTDGVTSLAGDDLAAAVDAYKKVTDTHEYNWDNVWYGWQLPAAENPPVPPVTHYTITASAEGFGTIVPQGDCVVTAGADQTYTMTPDEGYRIKSVMVDLKDVTWEEAVQVLADADAVQTGKVGTYTFSNVQADHDIKVFFEKAGGTTGEENPPNGDDPDTPPGNDKPNGGTTGSNPGNDNSDGGSSENADIASAAEMAETVVDGSVQAAPAAATETEVPAAQNGQNQTAADTQNKEPKTGDPTQMEIYATLAMIAGLTYMLLYMIEEGRGMTEREKEVFVAAFIRWAKKGGSFRKCCALVAIFCILAYYHSVGKCRKEKLYPVLH